MPPICYRNTSSSVYKSGDTWSDALVAFITAKKKRGKYQYLTDGQILNISGLLDFYPPSTWFSCTTSGFPSVNYNQDYSKPGTHLQVGTCQSTNQFSMA